MSNPSKRDRCMSASAVLNHDAYVAAKQTYTPQQQRRIETIGLPGNPAGRVPRYQPCAKAIVYQKYAGILWQGGEAPPMLVIQQEAQRAFCNCHDILTTDDLLAMEFSGGNNGAI